MKILRLLPSITAAIIATSALYLSATSAMAATAGTGAPSAYTEDMATPATTDGTMDSGAKASQALSDIALTTKVKTALAAHAGLKTVVLNVTSDKGTVTITGSVKSQNISDTVTTVARSVQGVMAVHNQLLIKP